MGDPGLGELLGPRPEDHRKQPEDDRNDQNIIAIGGGHGPFATFHHPEDRSPTEP